MMPGRKYSVANTNYRYGFNGKELDNEVSGTTTYDYGFRIYNPGLGRFLSVDPLTKSYSFYTPYQFAGNSPIANIDIDGAEPREAVQLWSKTKGFLDKGDFYKNGGALLKVEGYNVFVREWSSGFKEYFWYNKNIKNPQWQQFEPNFLEKRYKNLGNIINGKLDSQFEKAMFENYWLKKGDVKLSDYRFGKIKDFLSENKKIDFGEIKKDPHSKVIFEDGSQGYKTVASFYTGKNHEEYNQAFGSATIYLDENGKVVGLNDTYDFDTRMLRNLTPGKTDRSFSAELQTDAVAGAAAVSGSGKDFKVKYGKQEKQEKNEQEE